MVAKVSHAVTQAGAATALTFGLTPSEWSVVGVIGGLTISALGLVVNFWFLRRKLQLMAGSKRPGYTQPGDLT